MNTTPSTMSIPMLRHFALNAAFRGQRKKGMALLNELLHRVGSTESADDVWAKFCGIARWCNDSQRA